MAEKLFTSDERKTLKALAERRGFKSLRSYMQTLIQQDAEQHGEVVEIEADADDSDDLIDPVEGFKQGWADAMEGRTMSYEEFKRRMRDNAD